MNTPRAVALPKTFGPGSRDWPSERNLEFRAIYFGSPVSVYWTGGSYWPHWAFQVGAHVFCGVPNKCETRQAAIMRAWNRAKWLADGTFGERYREAVYA